MIKYITILIAISGLSLAFYAVSTEGQQQQIVPPPAAPPSINPFSQGIAAAGTIEAASRNIPVAATESGVVTEVYKAVGQAVQSGEPLFKLDTRVLESELMRARASEGVALARLEALKAQPRVEELPQWEAAVARAKARLADAADLLADTQRAASNQAVSPSESERRKYAVQIATAELEQAKGQLMLVKAGAWAPDLKVAQSQLDQARAEIASIQLRLDRLTVRAPITGTVLKRNIEPGQYASSAAATGATQAPFVVGDLSTLRVRARVDEEDAPLLIDNARGTARIRGVAGESLDLQWLWVEPLAQPKAELTGSTIERVDTRVIEVLFTIKTTPKARLFPGQVVDVFIESNRDRGVPSRN